MYVVTSRGIDIRYNNYYIDWTPFDGSQFNGWKKTDYPLEKPSNWDQMVKMAEDLAKPFPSVRVDLYDIDGKIYFSEMTFTPAKGTLILDDDQCEFEMGEWLDISNSINAKQYEENLLRKASLRGKFFDLDILWKQYQIAICIEQ